MATIRKRSGKYQVQVRKDGKNLSRTFIKQSDAIKWSKVLRPTAFKVIRPFLFKVSQCRLSRAIIGRTHTEDSARQKARFQAGFFRHQGFNGSQKSIC